MPDIIGNLKMEAIDDNLRIGPEDLNRLDVANI